MKEIFMEIGVGNESFFLRRLKKVKRNIGLINRYCLEKLKEFILGFGFLRKFFFYLL